MVRTNPSCTVVQRQLTIIRRVDNQQGVEKQASGRQLRQHQLKAQGSNLKGKNSIRSASSS
jgi:hypothetical protein